MSPLVSPPVLGNERIEVIYKSHQTTDQKEWREAIYSPCERYRYELRIGFSDDWQVAPSVHFIGLNPSTATEVEDDPTVRRCKSFAKDWGFKSMHMLNAFAFRATNPKDMLKIPNPIAHGYGFLSDTQYRWAKSSHESGVIPVWPQNFNDLTLFEFLRWTGKTIVACWGTHAKHLDREAFLDMAIPGMMCLGTNSDGSPKHPLYLPKTAELKPYN